MKHGAISVIISAAFGIVLLLPHLLGPESTPVPLRRQLGVNQV